MNKFKFIKYDNLEEFQKECNELLKCSYKLYGYPKVMYDYKINKMVYHQAFILKHDNYSWKDWE